MKILQLMLQNLAVASLVHNVMESVVQRGKLLQMTFVRMKFREVHILFHLIQLLRSDMLGRPSCTQSLQHGADDIDVLDILLGNACDIGSLVGYDLNQTLQLQLSECFADRGSADTELLSDCNFLQFFVVFIFSAQNIFAKLMKNPSSQGILVRNLLLYIITAHVDSISINA